MKVILKNQTEAEKRNWNFFLLFVLPMNCYIFHTTGIKKISPSYSYNIIYNVKTSYEKYILQDTHYHILIFIHFLAMLSCIHNQ